MKSVEGGYIAARAGEILNLLIAYREGISPAAIRVYLAGWLAADQQRFTHDPITLDKLIGQTGLSDYTIHEAMRELRAAELMTLTEGRLAFSPGVIPAAKPYLPDLKTRPERPVPIPKPLLKRLTREGKGSFLIGALAHLLRCLFIDQGDIHNEGFVSNEWITRLTGLCERTIRRVRNWMKEIGLLVEKSINARVKDVYGRLFTVNLNGQTASTIPASEPSKIADLSALPPSCLLYINNKYQCHTRNRVSIPLLSGVFSKLDKILPKRKENLPHSPSLKDIQAIDLQDMSRLEALYRQAVEQKWLPDSEASIQNFVGAATRAMQVTGNTVKIFVGIVKRGLWGYITQGQEEAGRQALNRYLAENPLAFGGKLVPPDPIMARIQPPRPQAVRPERVIIRRGQPVNPTMKPVKSSGMTRLGDLVGEVLGRLRPQWA